MISRDKRYAIVLNGEIYNYKELRERLLQFGFDEFRSKCDTEILLEYFSMFGVEKTLEDINGMYAIGLYDRQEKKLTLIRDRGGEKPLYYGWLGNRFVFASELKAIKAIDYNSELNVCEDSAKLFLKYGFIPQPVSIYEKIYKLMSGSYLEIKFPFDTISEPKRYWTYGKTNPEWEKLEYNEAKEVLKDLLKKSVSRQMVADVPYGAFLSGGIDSSLITSIMQSVSDKPIKTFTIGLDDERFNEAKHAKQIAKYLGTDHTEYYLTEKELLEYIPRMCRVYDVSGC
jgi:asparagine synthase (glutamine-hydrolysing)